MLDFRLIEDAVDIWHLVLDETHADRSVLAPDEIAWADRLKVDDKRDEFVAGRAQLRTILGRYLDQQPAEIAFAYGEHGKPRLRDNPEVNFNLSHSYNRGLLAVAANTTLGIDLERTDPRKQLADIAKRFFAEEEHGAMMKLREELRSAAFFRFWAHKEAYLKALGTGLSFPSNRFAIGADAAGPFTLIRSEAPDSEGPWQFSEITAHRDYAAALCYRGDKRWLRHCAPSSCLDRPPASS